MRTAWFQSLDRYLREYPGFRGLWRSREIKADGSIKTGWSVTFAYKGDYCETPYYDTPSGALIHAEQVMDKSAPEAETDGD